MRRNLIYASGQHPRPFGSGQVGPRPGREFSLRPEPGRGRAHLHRSTALEANGRDLHRAPGRTPDAHPKCGSSRPARTPGR